MAVALMNPSHPPAQTNFDEGVTELTPFSIIKSKIEINVHRN